MSGSILRPVERDSNNVLLLISYGMLRSFLLDNTRDNQEVKKFICLNKYNLVQAPLGFLSSILSSSLSFSSHTAIFVNILKILLGGKISTIKDTVNPVSNK